MLPDATSDYGKSWAAGYRCYLGLSDTTSDATSDYGKSLAPGYRCYLGLPDATSDATSDYGESWDAGSIPKKLNKNPSNASTVWEQIASITEFYIDSSGNIKSSVATLL